MEKCVRCGEEGEDRRTIMMRCFYAMDELEVPFEQQVLFHADPKDLEKAKNPVSYKEINILPGTVKCSGELTPEQFYTIRVCKACRADWLSAIRNWYMQRAPVVKESCGSGIFVRKYGRVIEVTREEWDEMCPGVEPVMIKGGRLDAPNTEEV